MVARQPTSVQFPPALRFPTPGVSAGGEDGDQIWGLTADGQWRRVKRPFDVPSGSPGDEEAAGRLAKAGWAYEGHLGAENSAFEVELWRSLRTDDYLTVVLCAAV
jgi:hypothetical protein